MTRSVLCLAALCLCISPTQGRHLLQGPFANLINSLTGGSGSSQNTAEDVVPSAPMEESEPEDASDSGAEASCEGQTIADVAAGVPELSTLVALVTAEGGDVLAAATNPETAVTIFAPTNDAFSQTLETLGITADDLIANKELLGTVLKYHIHGAPAKAADLTNGMTLSTLAGDGKDLKVELADGGVMIDGIGSDAKVIQADVEACKSVVHVIDNVLLPVDPADL